ncbi:unnamed protein product [Rotaria sp. Silwood2]|nr:unnamed protein product [Rotaria sp. Silwood2]
MGQKISILYNYVCNLISSKRSQNVSSADNKIEEGSFILSQPPRRRINQFDIWTPCNHEKDLILVWMDEQIDIDSKNTMQMKILLNKVNEHTLLFSNKDRFVKFVETLTHETIFLIISGQVSADILSFANSNEQIHAIYIFCMQDDYYKNLIDHYSKLHHAYNNHVELILEVQKGIDIYKKQSMKFNSLSKDEQESISNLSLESALFLWSYVVKEILINTDKSDDAKQVMLAHCRSQYPSGDPMLAQIDKFEKNYQSKDAIEWYTKDSFVHKLVNKLIRIENIDALLHLKFFIVDLSACLKMKWEQDYSHRSYESIKVFRGAQLTNTEIEKLKPDCLISPNGYFSMSESLETASMFAGNTLFEIDIDPLVGNLIFANIAEYSQFPQEQEILFDLGCEQLANDFFKTIKEKKKSNGYVDGLINDVVHKIGYEQFIRLYEHFLRLSTADTQKIVKNCFRFVNLYEKCCDASNVAVLYGCFGWFLTQRAEYDSAIASCTRALSLVERTSSNGNMTIEIAMIHNTIGWSYYEKEDYKTALDWCQKARKIFEQCSYVEDSKYVRILRSEQNLKKSPSRNAIEYAEILTNIGCIYYKKNDFVTAIHYCKKSMIILKQCDHKIIFDSHNRKVIASNYEIDNHHETLAANYEVFADVYYKKENYNLALEYYQKAQVIFETITPRIPICLQRSPSIFGRNIKRLQNSIRITERKLVVKNQNTTLQQERERKPID